MQLQLKNNIIKQKFINIYKIYNLFSNNYNSIVAQYNIDISKVCRSR